MCDPDCVLYDDADGVATEWLRSGGRGTLWVVLALSPAELRTLDDADD